MNFMKFIFGIKCRMCFSRYRTGGGKIQTTTSMIDICPSCCDFLENIDKTKRGPR